MPKSRKRKLTKGQKVKHAIKRMVTYVTNKEKVMPIYARALPQRQEYPPTIYAGLTESKPPEVLNKSQENARRAKRMSEPALREAA